MLRPLACRLTLWCAARVCDVWLGVQEKKVEFEEKYMVEKHEVRGGGDTTRGGRITLRQSDSQWAGRGHRYKSVLLRWRPLAVWLGVLVGAQAYKSYQEETVKYFPFIY